MLSSQFSSAATYCSRSALSLLSTLRQSLSEGRRQSFSPNQTLLFALAPSQTTPPEILSEITSTLTKLYPVHVGCVSAPLPKQCLDSSMHNKPNACFFAYAFVDAVSFRSTISGRAEAQVGRWHAARHRTKDASNMAARLEFEDTQVRMLDDFSQFGGKINWEDVWERASSSATRSGSGPESEALPESLRNLDPLAVDSVLYLSDKAPDGLANALEVSASAFVYIRGAQLSLIASSTPFITGRPVTLFHNGSIFSNGAVGIAFCSSPTSTSPVIELSFPPLVTLSPNLNVTSSQGNLILTLGSGNPTQLLLNAIRKLDLPCSQSTAVGKEDEFYVGVIDLPNGQISQLHRITAGDPSRGTIALDGASAPREGSIVRLYYLPKDPVPDIPTRVPDTMPDISLFVAPDVTSPASFGNDILEGLATSSDCSVVSNTFLAASENGFTLSRGAQGPWKCVVPGARMGLSWDRP